MIDRARGFLSDTRLLLGPWQAFERDVARLLIANGFEDVRLIGGSGDRGGDVLGVKERQLWVFQCKYTSNSPPPSAALDEVAEAGKAYQADRLIVATSRPAGDSFRERRAWFGRSGLTIELAEPAKLLGLMAASPEYPRSRRSLRPYQDEASALFRRGLTDTGHAQIVMATGLGKTVVMAETVADLFADGRVRHGRALVLAHTRELVDQLHRGFWYQLPKWVPTHQLAEGETPSFWEGITFATVQSAQSRLDTLPEFGLVLVDEAHHIGAEMFRRVIDAIKPPMLGGVTATPWRGDGFDIDQILGPPLYQIGIADGLRQGFLADVDYRLMADNLDWELVQGLSRNKYSLPDLNRRLIIPTRDEEAARHVREAFDREGRKNALVFSPTIAHAKSFAGMLRMQGLRAEALSSESDARERAKAIARFKAGHLDVLGTVDLFNEGVDLPDVDLLVFMRVTHSRRIFVQQLGRGLRLSPGKTKVMVLDFVTDLRRLAEVVELDRSVRGADVERLGLGSRLVQFRDASAGSFLREWALDQASLLLREGDGSIDMPRFDFPEPPQPGGVE